MQKLRQHNFILEGKTPQGLSLKLRPMTEDDWDLLAKWNRDPEVLYYTEGDNVSSYTMADVQEMYRRISQNALWFIIQVEGKPIGECCLQKMNIERILQKYPHLNCRRIDIMIGEKAYWNQGIGTEAIKLLTDFGFKWENADMIFYCNVLDYNIRSQRACQKIGYELIGEIKEGPGAKAEYSYDYVMIREKWDNTIAIL